MSIARRILPQPLVTFGIFGLWAVLAWEPSAGHYLLGAIIALLIPLFTQNFWPDMPRMARPWLALKLFWLVMWDIVVANWQVARLVLGPIDRLHPDFIEVPLDTRHPFVATLVASIISLTPGTVSVDIDQDRWVVLVHALNVGDPAEVIGTIKARYEAPLKEIYQC